ncbi:hypothetical protein T11_8258 [Trichinella zimbabwensis]|uniref:Uncharacterized protein n=1 Tax=Trichinella zimbabwensis TaxID=268475 RepID=A0A0V1HRU4_9BILA|nr:hypothetical protein T11_8258 [Trichinella zimbabwensis]
MEKKLELHGRNEALFTNIYKEASRTTADLKTSGRFPTYKNFKAAMSENREKISRAASNAPGAGNSSTLACEKVWTPIFTV